MSRKKPTPPELRHDFPQPQPPWGEPSRADFERYWRSVEDREPPQSPERGPVSAGDDFREVSAKRKAPRNRGRGR